MRSWLNVQYKFRKSHRKGVKLLPFPHVFPFLVDYTFLIYSSVQFLTAFPGKKSALIGWTGITNENIGTFTINGFSYISSLHIFTAVRTNILWLTPPLSLMPYFIVGCVHHSAEVAGIGQLYRYVFCTIAFITVRPCPK